MAAKPLPGFPVVIDFPLAWGEMDAFGHVNNVNYFRYFESARIAYFERIGTLERDDSGHGPILAETRCRFRLPLVFPDRITAGARVSAVGDDRFTMEYVVASEKAGRLAAEGEGVIVWYDYRARAKTPLPQALRDRIAQVERLR